MYVRVRMTPAARKESIMRIAEHRYEIAVREPAERNLANRRAATLLADAFKVSPRNVRLISGHRSHTKVFDVSLPVP
jgi:uncharacterized protein YggU (UPF0235/DUF167 family)